MKKQFHYISLGIIFLIKKLVGVYVFVQNGLFYSSNRAVITCALCQKFRDRDTDAGTVRLCPKLKTISQVSSMVQEPDLLGIPQEIQGCVAVSVHNG